MERLNYSKTAFIIGRPSGHPTHAKYARSVDSTFIHEDRILRWQDLNASKPRRYLSWLLNAFFFPRLNSWDAILTECVRVPQLIQKKLGLLSKKQKLIALMSDESLYFTVSKKYPKLTQYLMIQFWKSCDSIICIGEFQQELAKQVLPKSHHKKIYEIYNGVSKQNLNTLNKVQPSLNSKTIVFVGNATTIWRTEYKGLDIMLSVINELIEYPNLIFKIAGEIPIHIQSHLLKGLSEETKAKVEFLGKVIQLENLFSDACLYFHTARGEAWGISVNEAMAAGVPALVSEKTGAKSLVYQMDPNFVVPLDKSEIKSQLNFYLNLSIAERKLLSVKARNASNQFSEEDAILNFKLKFHKALSETH